MPDADSYTVLFLILRFISNADLIFVFGTQYLLTRNISGEQRAIIDSNIGINIVFRTWSIHRAGSKIHRQYTRGNIWQT